VAGREFLLGVDGGGTHCRARLAEFSGEIIGEGIAGPANIRRGLTESIAAVLGAARQCLAAAGLDEAAFGQTTACLALAGASEPADLAAAQREKLPFGRTRIATDAEAACIGAHGGRDGGVVIIGTGSIGWAIHGGRHYRVGGWGLPISDEGSGAWLGLEAVRQALWAYDGHAAWGELTTRLMEEFHGDPHAVVRWAGRASPADYGRFAPLVIEAAQRGSPAARELLRTAAGHIEALARRLLAWEIPRLALVGGLASAIEPYLAEDIHRRLGTPEGDGLSGALRMAAALAKAPAQTPQRSTQ
jgi:glucosamine kinase